ncbi:L-arabinose isomerase family protein [Yersinia pseudotuberculosis]|uniref:L-arabinose isomerase n=1 Tax=Yersinia pseudotuberculosis TaxID=633 RepID=UPI0005AD2890|nr:L-arabinose isomerase [Yersinia pseudotuberculosis]AJJ04677.1 L-arabinose isomerase family protein [Yersinia pseudotuberculosis]
MDVFKQSEVWFVIGSQNLYGPKTLQQVMDNAHQVVNSLNSEAGLPVKLVLKPLVTTPDEITALCREANYDTACIGIMTWLHTFSPAKMWIGGLSILNKPLLQFHTQFNAQIPWETMDMDFMNLNQTAHGGREFGFIGARMRQQHSVITGHWQDKEAHQRIGQWMRVAAVSKGDIDTLVEEYEATYRFTDAVKLNGDKRENLLDAARIELGMTRFLEQGGFKAFTTNFENLYGLKQLPGLAVQRLMQQGYGFGGEGDWKTAALLRILKVMGTGLKGGTSFMEDYTYNFQPGNDLVVGSHMLEVCPSIAKEEKPLLDVQHLGIGGKADPARLIFSTPAGPALNASLIDMGNRFRLLVNVVDTVEQPHPLPKLPVARAIWQAQPSLATAAEAWIIAGGAHHTVFSQAVGVDELRLYAEMHGIEFLLIDNDTTLPAFKNEIRWNEVYYQLNR